MRPGPEFYKPIKKRSNEIIKKSCIGWADNEKNNNRTYMMDMNEVEKNKNQIIEHIGELNITIKLLEKDGRSIKNYVKNRTLLKNTLDALKNSHGATEKSVNKGEQ